MCILHTLLETKDHKGWSKSPEPLICISIEKHFYTRDIYTNPWQFLNEVLHKLLLSCRYCEMIKDESCRLPIRHRLPFVKCLKVSKRWVLLSHNVVLIGDKRITHKRNLLLQNSKKSSGALKHKNRNSKQVVCETKCFVLFWVFWVSFGLWLWKKQPVFQLLRQYPLSKNSMDQTFLVYWEPKTRRLLSPSILLLSVSNQLLWCFEYLISCSLPGGLTLFESLTTNTGIL